MGDAHEDGDLLVVLDHLAEVAALPALAEGRMPDLSSAPPTTTLMDPMVDPQVPWVAVAIPSSLITRLLTYARGRLAAGVGVDRLQAAGLRIPDLRELYAVGFIPAGYRQALAPDDATALAGIDLGGCLVLPAFNRAGIPVDLDCWSIDGQPHVRHHLLGDPRALLAPRLAAVDVAPILVTDLAELARRVADGDRHALLLRPGIPVADQFDELRARGVARVRVAASDLAAACRAASLEVVDGDPVEAWALVTVDRDHHRAVFQAGDLTVSIETPWRNAPLLRIDARRADGRHQGDTIDLGVQRQRASFAGLAGRKLGVDAAILLRLLDDGIVARLRQIEAGDGPLTVVAAPAGPAAVDAILADPDLVGCFQRDMDVLGWIGDERAKHLGLLALAGRTLANPPWLLLEGPPHLTLPALGILGDLAPSDRRIHLARSVEGGLAHHGRDGLLHRLLLTDDAAALRPATVTALQVLQARGALAVPTAVRDAASGRMTSRLSECRGPVTLLGAAAGPCPVADLAVTVRLDDGPAQTARALDVAKRQAREGVDVAALAAVRARWQAVLASLPMVAVRIPGADRVSFPSRSPRHRVELGWLLGLAAASALLHHCQRPRVGEVILAIDADLEAAIAATRGVLGQVDGGLSERARCVLDLVGDSSSVTLPEVQGANPGWTRSQARLACEELIAAGLVVAPPVGRGRRARTYTLAEGAGGVRPVVHLEPLSSAPELATAPIPRATINPVRAAG